ILSALLVSPPESNITIFSDSETTIKFFDRLIIKNEYISTRRLVKENNYLLWGIIQDTVAELKQKIQIKKVKAHNGIFFNEKSDFLAKLGLDSDLLEIKYDQLPNFKCQPSFNNIRIEISLRLFLKNCTEAKSFLIWKQKNRNIKYDKSEQTLINWPMTWIILNSNGEENTKTSFNASNKKSFKVKKLIEELPTIESLKLR
ncbi:8801_t:CDS:1, partial [Entrophospora sp. SA101]